MDVMPSFYQQSRFWPTTSGPLAPCKALTLYPLWAWLIVYGPKRVENRTWATNYRGPLAIHAGKCRRGEVEDRAWLESLGIRVPAEFPVGAILGTVTLLDCVPYGPALYADPLASGPFCWLLEAPERFPEPIPARGSLGLWTAWIPGILENSTR
jgi:hypothetical protein